MGVDLLPQMQGDKDWSPEKWSPRHRLIVALHLGGDKNNEIAEKLGVSQSHVSVVLNDPRAVHEIQRMSQVVADRTLDTSLRLKLYANEALDEIVEEMRTARSEKVRQTAAFGILDRAGFTPVKQNERDETAPELPAEVVDRMEATTKEIIQYEGRYENVEPKKKDPEPDPRYPDVVPPEPGEPRGPVDDDD